MIFMSDVIEGRNPVIEALNSGRDIDKIIVAKGDKSLQRIIDMAREDGIPMQFVERTYLSSISQTKAHQGIIAYVAAHNYVNVEDILKSAKKRGEEPFVVLLDGICDPQNLGAILRSANGAGVHGIVIPKRRAVGLNATVAKTSAGAIEYTPVARVANLPATIDLLKDAGLWVFGATAESAARVYDGENLTGPIAVVIGAEGCGISSLVAKKCDFLVSIPMMGEIESLNASVAAGILLYEVLRQRRCNSK